VRPGMLHGVIVRAPVASGVLLRIDLAALRAAPGVDAAVRLAGRDGVIRYAGQPLAAVAADSRERAVEACRAAMFDIESRPSVCDVDHAMTDDAPLVHAGRAARKAAPSSAENPLAPAVWKGNRRGPSTVRWRGFTAARRLRAALSSADQFLVDQTYTTAVQVHTPLEPHACVAEWTSSGELHLWLSTQAMAHVGRLAAEYFDLPPERVTVTAEHVGGGFGAKLSLSPDIVAAVELSRAAKAPVRVVLDRHEELAVGGLRPGTRTRVELLADRRGDLQAMRIDSHGDGGVSVGSTVAGLGALMYGRGPRIVRDADVVTHAPPGTPFRGPGGPPMAWALEQAVDQMAHRLDVDPIVLRQRWDGNPKRKALYQWAAELPAWRERGPVGGSTGRFRRGVGVAAANWFYFVDPGTEVTVRVHEGRLRVECSTQDMGTGSRSVLAAGVAEVFGIDRSEVSSMIEVIVGHSGHGHGPVSGGSRTTVSIHPTAVEAATKLKAIVGDRHSLARHEGVTATATRGKDFRRRILPVTMREIQMGRGFSGAVHISEVEVDTRTGKVRALHVWGGIAVGRIVSHELARAQCEGSVIQGIGFALYEQRVLDPSTGHVLTANLEDYRIPQLGDTPEIDIHFHEHGWEHVPGGGIGLGEVATVGVAASIGNAIHHATGWRPLDLPVRPDRVLAGLS
jgi:xanthine dehydrogenase YagR molybdenum-binding subunit